MPAATFVTEEFSTLGRLEAEALGMPSLPLVIIPHPMGNLPQEKVHEAIDGVMDEVLSVLTLPSGELDKKYRGKYTETKKTFRAKPLFSWDARQEKIEVTDSLEVISKLVEARGWGDGLPIVPPTGERVSRMLEYTDRDRRDLIGVIPPRRGMATVEKIAINAVMAGCLPEYLPVILTAVGAMVEPQFNLYGIQATTNPVAPLVIVNGPLAKELDINCGYNVFGQGWRANATIGRALRLILTHIGGGVPGVLDRATQGQPGKYSFCIAENEEENPWEPLHVERGYDSQTSTVTVVGAGAEHNILDIASTTAQGTLMTLANGMAAMETNNAYLGGEPLLVICPESAVRIAQGGFTKKEAKIFLYENARIPLYKFTRESIVSMLQRRRPKWYTEVGPHTMVTIANSAEDIMVVVAGGAGPHSKFVPTFGASTKAVTKAITLKDGRPVGAVKEFKTRRKG